MKKLLATIVAMLMATLPLAVPVFGATADTTSVTSTVGNRAPVVYDVTDISAQDPTEGTTTTVTFNCSVNDPDGNADISVVNATFNRTGEPDRTDASCSEVATVNSTAKTYECQINMQFYDETGTWTDTCFAEDSGVLSDTLAETFTYNELEAWTMTPTSLNFGTIYLGQTSVGATDDPIVMTNTGNHDLTGEIKTTALDLVGTTTPSEYIPAGNFSVNVADSSGGDAMINNTAVTISSTTLDRGSSSTEDLYFYIEEVPASGLSYQVYDTSTLGEWTVSTA